MVFKWSSNGLQRAGGLEQVWAQYVRPAVLYWFSTVWVCVCSFHMYVKSFSHISVSIMSPILHTHPDIVNMDIEGFLTLRCAETKGYELIFKTQKCELLLIFSLSVSGWKRSMSCIPNLFHHCLLSSFVISDTVELPAPRVSLCFCVCVSVWHVMVWVCVVVGSIRRGPSLIESLRGWMSSWFTQSCSSVLYQTPVTNTLNRTEAEVQLATASSVWQTCPRLLLLLLFFYPSLRVRLIKGK